MTDFSRLPSFVLGFHGCDRSVGESLLCGDTRIARSENDYDWLGHGVYFWENDAERALRFANERKARPKSGASLISEPFVVGAVIDLGNCLNLFDDAQKELLLKAYRYLRDFLHESNIPLPVNRSPATSGEPLERNLDCAVVQHLHDIIKARGETPLDTVRAMFSEGDELYPGAGFRKKDHIQICVVNDACIRGYFRVR